MPAHMFLCTQYTLLTKDTQFHKGSGPLLKSRSIAPLNANGKAISIVLCLTQGVDTNTGLFGIAMLKEVSFGSLQLPIPSTGVLCRVSGTGILLEDCARPATLSSSPSPSTLHQQCPPSEAQVRMTDMSSGPSPKTELSPS
jgi:hypothetical protein